MHGEEKKKKSTAHFGGHCIGFLIPTVIVGLRGWNKSGCGQRTGEVEQVNSFTSAPISRALGFFPPRRSCLPRSRRQRTVPHSLAAPELTNNDCTYL